MVGLRGKYYIKWIVGGRGKTLKQKFEIRVLKILSIEDWVNFHVLSISMLLKPGCFCPPRDSRQ